tara:strand:- start:4750 stop:8220 length:3471 start_codon:yes stop_codon:yes gene_type:complete
MGNSAVNLGSSQEVDTLRNTTVSRISTNSDIFISPTGNDTTGDGTTTSPFATLRKAFDSIQAKRIDSGIEVNIILKDGEYTVDENFGPALVLEDTFTDSMLPDGGSGGTNTALINLSHQTHPDIDRIVIRGENFVSRSINDINGQSLIVDGAALSYNHVVGITTASGASAAEDDFQFSLSLAFESGDTLTGLGITGSDFLFTRMEQGSTRLSKIGTNWESQFVYHDMHGTTLGTDELKWHCKIEPYELFSYTDDAGNVFDGTGAPDTPRQLTRYCVLGSHLISGISGASNTGTGPADVGSNHAINTTHRSYIIDDRNFAFMGKAFDAYGARPASDIAHGKYSINYNFYADDFRLDQTPYSRTYGTLKHTDAVDYYPQFLCHNGSRIKGHSGQTSHGAQLKRGAVDITGNPNDQTGANSSNSSASLDRDGLSGHGFDGCTFANPAGGYFGSNGSSAHGFGISAGGSPGCNVKFTLDPSNSHPVVGLTGTTPTTGEYKKDKKIIATKYGAVLRMANSTTQVRTMFLVQNCNVAVRDLAVVGSHEYTSQYQTPSVKENFGFFVSARGRLRAGNIGVKDIGTPFFVRQGGLNLVKVTTGNHKQAINANQGSNINVQDSSFTANWGGNCIGINQNSNATITGCSVTGCRSAGVIAGKKSNVDMTDCLIMWTGQHPLPTAHDVLRTIAYSGFDPDVDTVADTAWATSANFPPADDKAFRTYTIDPQSSTDQPERQITSSGNLRINVRPSIIDAVGEHGAPRLVCNVGPNGGYALGAKENSLVTADRCVISHNGTGIHCRSGATVDLKNSQVMNSTHHHIISSTDAEVKVEKCIFFLSGKNCVLAIDGGLADITDASFFGWGKNGWITSQYEIRPKRDRELIQDTPSQLNHNWCMVAFHGTLRTTRCILDSTSYWGLEASVGSPPGNASAYYTFAGPYEGSNIELPLSKWTPWVYDWGVGDRDIAIHRMKNPWTRHYEAEGAARMPTILPHIFRAFTSISTSGSNAGAYKYHECIHNTYFIDDGSNVSDTIQQNKNPAYGKYNNSNGEWDSAAKLALTPMRAASFCPDEQDGTRLGAMKRYRRRAATRNDTFMSYYSGWDYVPSETNGYIPVRKKNREGINNVAGGNLGEGLTVTNPPWHESGRDNSSEGTGRMVTTYVAWDR